MRTRSRELIDSGLDQISFSFDGYDKKTYESIRVNADFEKTIGNIVRFLEIKKELGVQKALRHPRAHRFPRPLQGRRARRGSEAVLEPIPGPAARPGRGQGNAQLGRRDRGRERAKKKYSPCTFLWHALVIFWDGSVLPCTQDFHGYYTLGNVREETLARIWNSERMVRLREKVLRRDIADLETCSQCDRLWRDQFLGVPKEYL